MLTVTQTLGLIAVSWLSYQWYTFRITRAKVDHIPTIGSDGFIGSYLGAWKYFFSGHKMIEEGYRKYKGAAFKVPMFGTSSQWLVAVSGPEMTDELRKAPDSELTIVGSVVDLLQIDHILGKDVADAEWYHVSVTQKQMMRNVPVLLPDIIDEMQAAFEDFLPLTEDWTSYKAVDTLVHMICRMLNRFLFPTLQLHKDDEFLHLQTSFAVVMVLTGTAIGLFPEPLRPMVTRLISRVPSTIKKMKRILAPMLEERLKKDAEFGRDWEGKPNDLISWLLEVTPLGLRTVDDLVVRVLFTEFGGLHTVSVVVCDALFNLAARPEYIQPLREEVEPLIAQHGWKHEAFSKMHKLDSFIKESSRMGGLNSVAIVRKAAKDFTFANGITIPAGYTVGAVSRAMQHDDEIFEDAHEFDGFRFAKANGESTTVSGLTNPDINFLLFSSGRHHCPGRSMAVTEMKAMISHILINYDIRLPDDARTPPEGQWFGTNRGANTFAKLEFRKRQT